MGIFGRKKEKLWEPSNVENSLHHKDWNGEELARLLSAQQNLPEQLYGRSYLEDKIEKLREQEALRKYEQDFVPATHFDEDGFLDKFKEKVEVLWRQILIILIFLLKNGRDDAEGYLSEDMSEITLESKIEELQPWIKKVIAKNLLHKMTQEKTLAAQEGISTADAMIQAMQIECENLKSTLMRYNDLDKELCNPEDLDIEQNDPLWKEYKDLWSDLQFNKYKLEKIVYAINNYMSLSQKINQIQLILSGARKNNTNISLASKLEEQGLVKEFEKLLWQKNAQALNIFNLQWQKLPIKNQGWSMGNRLRLEASKHELSEEKSQNMSQEVCRYLHDKIQGDQEIYKVILMDSDSTNPHLTVTQVTEEELLKTTESMSSGDRKKLIESISKTWTSWKEIDQSEMLFEVPEQTALLQKYMRKNWPEDQVIFDVCDELVNQWLVYYEKDKFGDACTVFRPLWLAIRNNYLRLSTGKLGDRIGNKIDNIKLNPIGKLIDINEMLSGFSSWEKLPSVYFYSVRGQRNERKSNMEEDCYKKGYVWKSHIHMDQILNFLIDKFKSMTDLEEYTTNTKLKIYMYLTGARWIELANSYKWEEKKDKKDTDEIVVGNRFGSGISNLTYSFSAVTQKIETLWRDSEYCQIPLVRYL